MFQRTLVATDMLEACDAAVIGALDIAMKNQARLFIIHVLEPTYFHECGPVETVRDFQTDKETPATKEYKERVADELDKKCAGVLKSYNNYEIHIAYGRPSIEIRRYARKIGADLIILGAHAGKLEEGLIGTTIGNTVEDVIMHSTLPVIIINRLIPREKFNFKKIMVCIDFSKSCKYACDFALNLAHKNESKLFLFHMIKSNGSEQVELEKKLPVVREKLKEFCNISEVPEHEYIISIGNQPHLEILRHSLENNIDLIVMGSYTRDISERPYLGSVVERVCLESACPVAVISYPVTV